MMKILTGNKDKKDYTEFKYVPSDITIGTYYDKETGEDIYYNLLNLSNVISVTKKEFRPYNKVTCFENSDYGRINHSFIELDFKTYNKELGTINHYCINPESETKCQEIIQSLKDIGFVMSEGRVKVDYGNEYLSECNKVLGKYIYEKYERKD